MPRFTKVSEEEKAALTKKQTTLDLTEYKEYLQGLAQGEWHEMTPEEGEVSRVIKRRLTVSAKELNMDIKYKPKVQDRIIFEVKTAETETGTEEVEKPKAKAKAK